MKGYTQNKEPVTLAYCYEKAVGTYPLLSDKESLKNASDLRVKNLETNYLPQFSLSGQVTYQSDVTQISLPPQMGITVPGSPKDQYKVTIDAQQTLFDGGITSKQKKLEQASSAAEIQQIESDLLRIKEQVNSIYFTILLLQENKKLLRNVLDVITEREKSIQSMVKNGVLLLSDQNALIAERLKTEQQIAEIEISQSSTLRILNLITNETFTDSTIFYKPEIVISDTALSGRPEYKTFELQEKRFDAAISLSQSSLMPKLYAFGQYGYGRPGLNMLHNEFDNFYMAGATLKWTFWDWNKTRREKQVYAIQKQMIASKRDNFTKNLNMDMQNKLATIYKMEEATKRDSDIVTLRAGITLIAQSQLNNGVITSTDYLNELNAETQARINMETHKIQLTQAKANYLVALGK
jgi:outer membrane protein TolC